MSDTTYTADIIKTSSEKTTLYKAELVVRYKEKEYKIEIDKLVRKPSRTSVRLEGEYLLIELFDEKGTAIATCCIHRGHLEKGCMDCPSLLCPPRSY